MLVMHNLSIHRRTRSPFQSVRQPVVSPDLLVVILAAGASRRLGSAKQLVSIGGETLLRRQCRCALDADVGPVLVVLGHDADRHKRLVADLPLDVRVNDEWQEGIAATLRLAVGVAIIRRAALLVLPCDQYRIAPNDLRTLRDTWRLTPTVACVSRWGDCAGSPAILPIAYHEEALSLRGDTGARALLYAQGRSRPAEVVNPRAPYDLDSPRDLTIAQAHSATLRQRFLT